MVGIRRQRKLEFLHATARGTHPMYSKQRTEETHQRSIFRVSVALA